MKLDSIETKTKTLTFSKSELIDMMLEHYQRASGIIMKDFDKSKCRLMANSKETHHVELVFSIEKIEGTDYNGQ